LSSFLASLGGQDDNNLVVWNAETGKAVCGSPASQDLSLTVAWANTSDDTLVTGGNYNLRVWSFSEEIRKIRPMDCNLGKLRRVVLSVLFDEDDSVVYCGTSTGDVMKVLISTKNYSGCTPTKFGKGVCCISQVSATGDLLVGIGDGTVAMLDCGKLSVKASCKLMGGVSSISLDPTQRYFYAGTDQSNRYFVDVQYLQPELANTAHFEKVNCVAFPAGYSSTFATCSLQDIRLWDAATRNELLRIQVPNVECNCIAFSMDGRTLISGWSDGKIRAFGPQTGRLCYVINDAHKGGVTAVSSTSDCTRVLSGGVDGKVRVWKIEQNSQSMLASMKEHNKPVTCIVCRRDEAGGPDPEFLSASADGSCIVWSLSNYHRSNVFFSNCVFKAAQYHPDGSQIITGGSDKNISFWDCGADNNDQQQLRVLEASESGEINTLAMSEDGQYFASGGGDKTVKLWNYDEGFCASVGTGHSQSISSVVFSPDGRNVVSASAEGAIFIWSVGAE
jgi:WD40 repeat protein